MNAALLPHQSAFGAATLPPYRFLALDIETAQGRPEAAERAMRLAWTPNKTWKPETIGNRYLEMLAKKEERLALLDGAPVIAVSLRSDTEHRCLHSMSAHPPKWVDGGLVEGFASQRECLIALRGLLDSRVSPDTVLVGHNILLFDLRRLRWAYVRAGVRLPLAFAAKDQPAFDTMREYGHRFSGDGDTHIALRDVCESFGLTSHKSIVDGAQVPELFAAGQFEVIVQYSLLDVIAEADLYLRMTGQHGD